MEQIKKMSLEGSTLQPVELAKRIAELIDEKKGKEIMIIDIREACKTLGGWRLTKARLYVTLEPCPMCAGAILNAKIGEVHYGARDESMGACGSVLNLFEENFGSLKGPRLYRGPLEQECGQLLTDFFSQNRKK